MKAEKNKQLVIKFYKEVHDKQNIDAADVYLVPDYKQHNPHVANGRDAFKAFFRGYFEEHPDFAIEIKRVVAEGDLVVLHSHSRPKPEDRGLAVVDIFRVDGEKIVEHWDVLQPIPESSSNENTMF